MKPIISMMAAPKEGTSSYEDSLIEKALMEVWSRLAVCVAPVSGIRSLDGISAVCRCCQRTVAPKG